MRLLLLAASLTGQFAMAGFSMEAVKVMALGDSLTEYHAYRARFMALAAADNADVTMVGPKADKTGAHAGFSGRAIGSRFPSSSSHKISAISLTIPSPLC